MIASNTTYRTDTMYRKVSFAFGVFEVGELHTAIKNEDVAATNISMDPTKFVQIA